MKVSNFLFWFWQIVWRTRAVKLINSTCFFFLWLNLVMFCSKTCSLHFKALKYRSPCQKRPFYPITCSISRIRDKIFISDKFREQHIFLFINHKEFNELIVWNEMVNVLQPILTVSDYLLLGNWSRLFAFFIHQVLKTSLRSCQTSVVNWFNHWMCINRHGV